MNFTPQPVASAYDQAKDLLQKHRRLRVGDALQRGGKVADAIAELAFAGQRHWIYQDVIAREQKLAASTMSVGHWLGRYHSSKENAKCQ